MFQGALPHGRAPGKGLAAPASRAAEQSRPRQGFGFAQPRSPDAPRFASRLPSVLRRRCFSPTSATNVLHVHPWIGRLPNFATRAATTTRRKLPPSRPLRASRLRAWRAAPDRLATIRPQVSTRLTARTQLRPSHAQPSSRIASSSGAEHRLPDGAPFATAFSAVSKVGERTSDAPFRAPLPPGRAGLPRSTRTASTAFASTNAVFPARNAFHRRVLQRARFRERSEPATGLADWPPAIRLPTLFHPRRSRVGG